MGSRSTKTRQATLPGHPANLPALPIPGAVLVSMFALNDAQLEIVMVAAGSLPAEKRSVFLERVAARLQLRGPHFTDADLGAAIQAALTGLIQSAA